MMFESQGWDPPGLTDEIPPGDNAGPKEGVSIDLTSMYKF